MTKEVEERIERIEKWLGRYNETEHMQDQIMEEFVKTIARLHMLVMGLAISWSIVSVITIILLLTR